MRFLVENAEKAAHGYRLAASVLDYKAAEAAPSAWQWQAWSGSTCVATSMDHFPTQAEALSAAEDVTQRMLDAVGP